MMNTKSLSALSVVSLFGFLLSVGGCSTRTQPSVTQGTPEADSVGTYEPLPGERIEVDQAAIAVTLESDRESLFSDDGEMLTDLKGNQSCLVMVESLQGESIENIQIRLDDTTGRPVSPTWSLDSIVAAEPILFRRLDWTFDGNRGSHDLTLHISYRMAGRTVRFTRPCQLMYPGIQATRLEIPNTEENRKSNSIVSEDHRDQLGYDFSMATEDRLLTTLEFRGPEAMLLRTTTFRISEPSNPGLKLEIVKQDESEDQILKLEVLLTSRNVPVGRHAIRLIAEYIADDFSTLRTWEVRVGVHDLSILRQDDRSTVLQAKLPSGAQATLELPIHRVEPRTPTDVAMAQLQLTAMSERHLPSLLEGATLRYEGEAPGAEGDAWKEELGFALGSSFAYQACLDWARKDVAAGSETASAGFDLAYLRGAQDMGISAGPGLLKQSIGDWRPTAEMPQVTLERPELEVSVPVSAKSFQTVSKTLEARLTTVHPTGEKSISAELLAATPLPLTPIDLDFALERRIGDGIVQADLLLLDPSARSIEIEQNVKGKSTRFHVSNLSPGQYRGSLVLRNSRREIVGVGRSFRLEVSGNDKKKEIPEDLLSLLSPTERKRLNSGRPYSKTVVRTDPSGTRMVVKRVVLQRSDILNKGKVSIELAGAHFDAKRGVTVLRLRVTSKEKKAWNLTLKAAENTATDVLSKEPAQKVLRKVRMELDQDQPELVTIDVPGEIGDTLSVVQATVDGSPDTMSGLFSVGGTVASVLQVTDQVKRVFGALRSTRRSRQSFENRSLRLSDLVKAYSSSAINCQVSDPNGAEGIEVMATINSDIPESHFPSGLSVRIPSGTNMGGAQNLVTNGSGIVKATRVKSSLEDAGADTLKCVCVESEKEMPKTGAVYQTDGVVDQEKQRFLNALKKLRPQIPKGMTVGDFNQLTSWGHDKLAVGVSASPMTKGKLKQAVKDYMAKNSRMVKNLAPKEREIASSAVADVMMKAMTMCRREP